MATRATADLVVNALVMALARRQPDGEVIHVRSTKHHGTIKLWMRAENDLENRHDCYEAFCDFEVEETGEQGTGTAEYSIYPPYPQWLV